MAVLSRDHAIEALAAGQAALDSLLLQLNDLDLSEPATIGGGAWAAKDVIGHIAFWEELALQALDAWRGGLAPRATGANTDALNAENQAEQAGTSATELRSRAASAHEALLAVMRNIPDAEWHAPVNLPSAPEATLGALLGGILGAPERPFGHVYAHLDDLRAFAAARPSSS
jgi:hypothetical protein